MPPRPSIRAALAIPVTSGLILLSAIVSVLWWSGWNIEWSMETSETFPAQPWRLLTSALPHQNLLHLGFNVFWLWWFGSVVEHRLGHPWTAGIMALTAVSASAAEYALLNGAYGLSGIVFGLFGLLWVLSTRDERFRGALSRTVVKFFIACFFICILLTVTNIWPIANVAHAAGFVVGVLIGFTMTAAHGVRARWVAALSTVVLVCVGSAAFARPYINLSTHRAWELAFDGYNSMLAERYTDAISQFEEALRIDPRQADWWFNYGIACQRDNRLDLAIDAYERALALNPALDCRTTLAYLLVTNANELADGGNISDALTQCCKAVEVDPMYSYGWFYKGAFEFRQGRPLDGRRSIEQAIRLEPDHPLFQARLNEFLSGTSSNDGRE